MNNLKFLKSVSFWFAIFFFLLALFFTARSVISNKTKYQNLGFTVLVQNINFNKEQNFQRLLIGQFTTFEFNAKYNNLGGVEVLFNNFGKVNSDYVTFRLREKGSKAWYYENNYPTSLMDSAQFFPFGFPVIENSKDKTYVVSIESVNGKDDNSVSISNEVNYFQTKYLFSKDYLLKNKSQVFGFLMNKTKNILGNFEKKDWQSVVILSIIPLVFYFVIKKTFTNLDEIILRKFKTLKLAIIKNKFFVLIIGLYIFTRIRFLSYSPYWDAFTYWVRFYNSLDNFRNTLFTHGNIFVSFIQNFNFFGHPSMGYILLMSLSQIINFRDVVLFNLENLFLAVVAIGGFYSIVKYFFPNDKFENYLITFIFAFNPLIYATSISFNLDFPVLVFEVLMIATFLYKKYLWFLVFSILLILSKETGILLYYCFMPIFILHRIEKKNLAQIFSLILPTVVLVLYMAISKGNTWTVNGSNSILSGSLFKCSSLNMFCFRFSLPNINRITYEIFRMNFNWIFSLSILVGFWVWLKAKFLKYQNKIQFTKTAKVWIAIHILVFTIFVIFNLSFVVMPFPRYVVAGIYFIAFLSYVSLKYVFLNKKARLIILTLISVLTFVQVFKSLDPYANLSFGKDFLKTGLISPNPNERDGMIFNSQFTDIDRLEQKVINGTNNGPPLVHDPSSDYFFKEIKFINTTASLENLKNKGLKQLTYVYFPWFTNREESLKQISKYYDYTLVKTISSGDYYVEIYNLVER